MRSVYLQLSRGGTYYFCVAPEHLHIPYLPSVLISHCLGGEFPDHLVLSYHKQPTQNTVLEIIALENEFASLRTPFVDCLPVRLFLTMQRDVVGEVLPLYISLIGPTLPIVSDKEVWKAGTLMEMNCETEKGEVN